MLPHGLQIGVERELERIDRARLVRAAEQITANYKASRFCGALNTPEARTAYLLTRLPATFEANRYVFLKVARLAPELRPQSMLDLGAGPGTAMWAAREAWPGLAHFTLIESNREFRNLGERLATGIGNVEWMHADVNTMAEFPECDLVVLSYSLGEFSSANKAIEKAWRASRKMLVIIEPGTPKNFAAIAAVRRQLIEGGANPIAPCPHSNPCPMAQVGDWCHFAVRVGRTAEHRRLKSGALGYEDEKFSYLAFSKPLVTAVQARIVRHPRIHSGHIQLTLCTAAGLMSPTVTRSDKQAFREARKAEWGDAWPLLPDQLE